MGILSAIMRTSSFRFALLLMVVLPVMAQTPAPKPAQTPAQKPAEKTIDKAAPAAAQKPAEKAPAKAVPFTTRQIVFRGETPYSQAALEAASGLKTGAEVTEAQLRAASDRLIQTGAFEDVEATFEGPAKAVDVVFTVRAAKPEHMMRPSFDNFVWYSSQDLKTEIQKRVPLYDGRIPEGGSIEEAVQAALQQALKSKGVDAKVASQLVAPRLGQPFRLAEFHVVSPDVRLHELNLLGVPPAFTAATDGVVRALKGAPYDDGLVGGWIDKVLEAYRNAGYQQASIGEVSRSVASSNSVTVQVDVNATVHPGEQYRLAKLTWAGSPLMSAQAFDAAAKVHAGDIASQQAIRDSLANLEDAYRNKGYVDVAVDATPKFDAAGRQAAFTVSVNPGPQYKLRELNVMNLTAAQKKDFDAAWKVRPGDVYNAGYVTNFLKDKMEIRALANYSSSFKVIEDPEAGVLDLNITFDKNDMK